MIVVKSIEEFKKVSKNLNSSIGFVPTMGALHNGHISLIEKSTKENDITVVSIFVNPTQFLEGEDFSKYPRKIEADIKSCELAKVDILFMPNANEVYSKEEELTIKAPKSKSYILEGLSRPKHFDGVLQVVLKLFNMVKPDRAYFGRKDAQQVILIKSMVKSLFLNIEVVDCDTVREIDGLALSSRNIYLSKESREDALLISKSLKKASKEIMKNILEVDKLKLVMQNILKELNIDYIEVVDRDLNHIEKVKIGNTIILVAIKIEGVRYIDNIWV